MSGYSSPLAEPENFDQINYAGCGGTTHWEHLAVPRFHRTKPPVILYVVNIYRCSLVRSFIKSCDTVTCVSMKMESWEEAPANACR